jgi:hypothetical protein
MRNALMRRGVTMADVLGSDVGWGIRDYMTGESHLGTMSL